MSPQDKDIVKLKEEYLEKLQKIAGLTREEAKKALLEEIEREETQAAARIIKEKEEEAKLTADKKAQEIIVSAMRHGAISYIPEYTVSTIKIEDEDLKGRIIGKEGRNIRAFEHLESRKLLSKLKRKLRRSCLKKVKN
ncbi:MAG: DUF3552 domain-containing protein [Candidatus Levybacteria bacterium]|nr:DUF3552 domain-containing protein [Candidatus Levybacteria bacterium]